MSATTTATTTTTTTTEHDYASLTNNKVIVLCLEGCHGVGKTHVCSQFERYLRNQTTSSRDITFLDEAFMSAASPLQPQPSLPTPPSQNSKNKTSALPTLRQGKEVQVQQQQQQQQQEIEMPEIMHPQSQFSELNWVANWFQRVMTLKQQHVLQHQHIANQLQCGAIPVDSPQYLEALKLLKQPKLYVVDRSPYSAVFYTRNGRGETFLPMIQSTIEELKQDADIHIFTVCLQVSNMEILWNRISERLKREPMRAQFNESSREWMSQVYHMYDTFKWDFTLTNDSGFEGSTIFDILSHIEDTVLESSLPSSPMKMVPTAAGSPLSKQTQPKSSAMRTTC